MFVKGLERVHEIELSRAIALMPNAPISNKVGEAAHENDVILACSSVTVGDDC